MAESDFYPIIVEAILAQLEATVPNASAESGVSLVYATYYEDCEGADGGDIKTYQTDILVFLEEGDYRIPLVYIEVKLGSNSTPNVHELLAYNEKVRRHKEFYPHLMAVLVVVRRQTLQPRVPRIGTNFDYLVALPLVEGTEEIQEGPLDEFAERVAALAAAAENLKAILAPGPASAQSIFACPEVAEADED